MSSKEAYKQAVVRKKGGDHRDGDREYLNALWSRMGWDDRSEVLHFVECINEGTSPTLAEMFASAQAPCAVTDATFLAGHCNGSQFAGQEAEGDFIRRVAESEGQSVKGKVYLGGLAKYPGDPKAWVDGRGDVKKVCEERGWNCEGSVNVKSFEPPGRLKRKTGKGELKKRLKAAGLPVG